ncbi:MAG: NADH-quinone oxidoreductase subunit NuoH [Chloroflexi bacterium]|nr:NADH-quinone oxidoreductase subunit NuoH [Chloroflexota bacterium]MDA1147758.1 NADH-quinone oxidoreductase subunit NuoH [Chloroflexota bacterium]MQC83095.1 NADH-quinone oxidoreductase subunit NuoH [Chloroflexota bacterium]PKB56462.1 MAG: NADH-quinone oxidoreductase subunit H [SAR202 cluster bacterium Casp-Chloro-G1]
MSDQPVPRRPATPMAQQILDRGSLLDDAKRLPSGVKAAGAVFALGFLAVNVAIAYIVIDGRLDGHWYDFRDLGNAIAQLRTELDDTGTGPWLSYWVTGLIGGVAILSFLGGFLLIGSWIERRLLARFQIRMGPNRVGPFGLLQPLADALKLMQKEVLIPIGADRLLFFLPPILVFIPAMLAWGPVPWAPNMAYLDINVGLLYVISITSLSVLAIWMAGWSSNNHYALLGAMRTVAMMVSYEIPISLSLLVVVLLTGSLNLNEIVAWQGSHNVWMAFLLPFSMFTFFFSSTAEINRTPNDIAEAESEIVAGFHTEYSGMKAGLFLAVELGNALLVGALFATFFLGGYTMFGLEEWVPPYLILAVKATTGYFFFIWLRGTLPRFRIDQLMTFAWKYLIPLSIANVLIVAVEATIAARWEAEGIVIYGSFALVNLALTVYAVRAWARVIGYSAELEHPEGPRTADRIGGLKAARQIRTGA